MGALDQGRRQMEDQDRPDSSGLPEGGSAKRDMRFAGGVSAGLISTILVSGALLAPVTDLGSRVASREGVEVRTLELPSAPRADAPSPAADPATPEAAPLPVTALPAVAPAAVPDAGPGLLAPAGDHGDRPGAGDDARAGGSGSAAGGGTLLADPADPRALIRDDNGDGVPDQRFQAYDMSPLTRRHGDADGDTIENYDEILSHTAPNTRQTHPGIDDIDLDSDGDGLRNGVEVKAGTAPYSEDSNDDGVEDGLDDADGDGLTNRTEQNAGTAVDNPDTDGDGVSDAQSDSDGDGLINQTEQEVGSNPAVGDSNGAEIAAGTDPNSAGSSPAPATAAPRTATTRPAA